MKKLVGQVRYFNEERGWKRFHDPRSLILALCSELAELAHVYRWPVRSARRISMSTRSAVKSELGDTLIYVLGLCDEVDIDSEDAIRKKLDSNAKCFPTLSRRKGYTSGDYI